MRPASLPNRVMSPADCPQCGASNPPQARFCNQCGTALGAAPAKARPAYTPAHLAERVLNNRAAMEGERKRVTVLFADIKGSTALAQQAGAEAWHGILDRFFALLSDAVHRYEGTVNQYTGDGIMALFGAPIAHEDHAQRACFAALEMSRSVRRFADELRLKSGLNLSMRVGLNTGEVIVGKIGDNLRMDYTAQGLTVNLAARMEQICEPGRIYLTRQTAALAEGYFRLRSLGEMQVDGAPEPVAVSELEGEGPLRTRLDRQLARAPTRFLGRQGELARLRAALDRTRQGDGQVVAVIGHAGIGKSRLCHEFVRDCEQTGYAVYQSTGVPYAQAVPLYPIQTLIRARLGAQSDMSPEALRKLVAGTFVLRDASHANLLPALLAYLGAGSGAVEAAAELQGEVLDLLVSWLAECEQPQVLLVEDLHFLDSASEDFIERLCRAVAGTHTLLLLNYRPDYLSEHLLPVLDEQIAVAALQREDICVLVNEAVGPDPQLEAVRQRICERAHGNPFYAEEAIQSLIDEGIVSGVRGAFRAERVTADWDIPDTVHALIAARIDRLDEVARRVLHTAAVVGQSFRRSLLARVLEPAEAVDGELEPLEEGGYVHRQAIDDEDGYRFCHPLVQEVAYQTQLESRRAEIHERLAELLSAQEPLENAQSELAAQVAHHYERAGRYELAGRWNLQAGRGLGSQDMNVCAEQFRSAVRNLDRAETSPAVVKGRIQGRAGLLRMAQFTEMPEAEVEQAFAEAQALAEELDDLPTRAELLISAGMEMLHRGQAERAAEHVSRATDLCVASGAGELVHRFRVPVLVVHNAAGQPREGIACANRGAGDAWLKEPVGEENYLSRGFYGAMLMWLGELDEARRQLLDAARYADKEDRAASWLQSMQVDLGWFTGEFDGVMLPAQRALDRALQFGSPFFRAVALRAHALACVMAGEPEQALKFSEQGLPIVRPGAPAYQLEANHLAVHSEVLAALGRIDDARAAAEAGIASGQQSGSKVWEVRAWIALLSLPVTAVTDEQVHAGLSRLDSLVAASGADGFKPWLAELRARWSDDPEERERQLARARELYAAIGAPRHAQRLAQ